MEKKNSLFVVATPIGNLNEISQRALDVLKGVDVIACEDTRNSKKLLSHFDIHTKLIAYHNFNEVESAKGIIELLKENKSVALISDAGYPLISDPGFELVNQVNKEGFEIVVISGANAALNALVASGLDTKHYLFYGFLNAKKSIALKELEELKDFPFTIIFYEAPHRLNKTLAYLLEVLGNRKICIARELTKIHEEYLRGKISDFIDCELKGEIVLVVEGKIQEETFDMEMMLDEVKALIDSGLKSKDAVGEIAKKYHFSKNILYNNYLKVKKA